MDWPNNNENIDVRAPTYGGKAKLGYDHYLHGEDNLQFKESDIKRIEINLVILCKDQYPEKTDKRIFTQTNSRCSFLSFNALDVSSFILLKLQTTEFNNGDKIEKVNDIYEWENAVRNRIPALYTYSDGTIVYNYFCFIDKRGIIPKDWMVHSTGEVIIQDLKFIPSDYGSCEDMGSWLYKGSVDDLSLIHI